MQGINFCSMIKKCGLSCTSFVLNRPAKSALIGGDRPSKRHPLSRHFQPKSAKLPAKKPESKEEKLKGKKTTPDIQRSGLRKDVKTDDIHMSLLPQRNLREVKVLLTAVSGEVNDKKENKSKAAAHSNSVAAPAAAAATKAATGKLATEGSPQKRGKKKKGVVDEVHPLYAGGTSEELILDDFAFYVPLAERVKLRRTGKSPEEKEVRVLERRKHTGRKQDQAAGIETSPDEPEKSKCEDVEVLETDGSGGSPCSGEPNLSGMKRTSSPKKKIVEIDPQCARRRHHLRSGSRLVSLQQQQANSESSESDKGKLLTLDSGGKEASTSAKTNKAEEKVAISMEGEASAGLVSSSPKHSCRKSKRTTRRSGRTCEKEQPTLEVCPANPQALEEHKEENTGEGLHEGKEENAGEGIHEENVVESDLQQTLNSSFYRDMPELSLVTETSPDGTAVRPCVGFEVAVDDCPVLEDCRSYESLVKIPFNVCSSRNRRKRARTESATLEVVSSVAVQDAQRDVHLTDGDKIDHVDGKELELPEKVAKLGDYCQVLPGTGSPCNGIDFTDAISTAKSSETRSSSNAFESELSPVAAHSCSAGPVAAKRQSRKSFTPRRFQKAVPEQPQTMETAFAINRQDVLGIGLPVHRVLHEPLPLVHKVTTPSPCNFRVPFSGMVSSSIVEAPVTVSNVYDSRASSAIGSGLSMVRLELESVQKVLQERGGGASEVFSGGMPQLGCWPSFESSYPSQGSFATSIPSTFGINSTSAFPSRRSGSRGGFPLPLDIVEPQVHPLPMHLPFVTHSVPVTHSVNFTNCLNFSNAWRGERILPGFCLPQNFHAPSYHHQLGLNAPPLSVNNSSSSLYIQNPNLVPEFAHVPSNQQVR